MSLSKKNFKNLEQVTKAFKGSKQAANDICSTIG